MPNHKKEVKKSRGRGYIRPSVYRMLTGKGLSSKAIRSHRSIWLDNPLASKNEIWREVERRQQVEKEIQVEQVLKEEMAKAAERLVSLQLPPACNPEQKVELSDASSSTCKEEESLKAKIPPTEVTSSGVDEVEIISETTTKLMKELGELNPTEEKVGEDLFMSVLAEGSTQELRNRSRSRRIGCRPCRKAGKVGQWKECKKCLVICEQDLYFTNGCASCKSNGLIKCYRSCPKCLHKYEIAFLIEQENMRYLSRESKP